MMAMVGVIGVAVTAVGTLALGVFAGSMLMTAMLRVLEASIPRNEGARNVADFTDFAHRSNESRATAAVELEQAA